ncbi:MAG: 30S ribosomal protein S8 [Candidatus Omnitrophica bacterium]|nr:30S ribosomal protein S8 [Candidatus Omnitrophota bacterium]
MASQDLVSDNLTKIRNASRTRQASVDLFASRLTERILDVLKQEGFIRNYRAVGEQPSLRRLRVYLKYVQRMPAIQQVVRVSKPGERIYRRSTALPRVLRGLGVAVLSTSKGIMTEREAARQRVGGEVLCYVW